MSEEDLIYYLAQNGESPIVDRDLLLHNHHISLLLASNGVKQKDIKKCMLDFNKNESRASKKHSKKLDLSQKMMLETKALMANIGGTHKKADGSKLKYDGAFRKPREI